MCVYKFNVTFSRGGSIKVRMYLRDHLKIFLKYFVYLDVFNKFFCVFLLYKFMKGRVNYSGCHRTLF